jgi:hypothetical protein
MCGARTDPIHGCFHNRGGGGLNSGDLPSWRGSRARELVDDLRLGTTVPSQDLSGA